MASTAPARIDRVNILLVDDQPAKLLTYQTILDELGETLISASSASEALQHLLRSEIAVVLVDVCMPDLDGYELASRQLTELQKLLDERPDPATLEASAGLSGELPYLPIEEAAQAIAARVTYIDTPELSGVAYVTGFRQDVFPFARGDFWYTFQGLSTDGRWYVAVDWLLDASMFPATITQADARRVGTSASRWERYVKRTVATLDAAEPTAFTPSLTVLDDLVRSIDFASVVAPTPSASQVNSTGGTIEASAPSSPSWIT